MHVVLDTSLVTIDNVISQVGSGYYFDGIPYQRGGGVADTLRRFWRFIMPLASKYVTPIAREVGKEGLRVGSRVLSDVAEGQRLSEAIKEQGKTGLENVFKRMQTGTGRRRKTVSSKTQTILKPNKLTGRLCAVPLNTKKLRKDALGLY